MAHRHHHHLHDGADDRGSVQDGTPADHGDATLLEATFIEGFRSAEDKASFIRLAGVPHDIPGEDGQGLKLIEVRIADAFEVGTASPGFGTSELVYHPFPGAMVRRRTRLRFVYCSLYETRELTWADVMVR